jgi:glutathione S-transferase
MITIHHLNNSRSFRVLWLLEELGMEYKLKKYERNKQTMLAPPEMKSVHPLGKSPILTDGDVTVAESAAILEYILDKDSTSTLRPDIKSDYAYYLRCRYWMHYSEGSFMPLLLLSLVMQKLGTAPTPVLMRPVGKVFSLAVHSAFITPELTLHLKYINNELEKFEWLAGPNFSAADIQMTFPLEGIENRMELDSYPNIRRFLVEVRKRPAYKRAIGKGGALNLEFK